MKEKNMKEDMFRGNGEKENRRWDKEHGHYWSIWDYRQRIDLDRQNPQNKRIVQHHGWGILINSYIFFGHFNCHYNLVNNPINRGNCRTLFFRLDFETRIGYTSKKSVVKQTTNILFLFKLTDKKEKK